MWAKHLMFLLIAALVVLTAITVYRTRKSGPSINVEPDAAREIEKAKRR